MHGIHGIKKYGYSSCVDVRRGKAEQKSKEALAKNKTRWRSFVKALCST
jgi:hypothetical protein